MFAQGEPPANFTSSSHGLLSTEWIQHILTLNSTHTDDWSGPSWCHFLKLSDYKPVNWNPDIWSGKKPPQVWRGEVNVAAQRRSHEFIQRCRFIQCSNSSSTCRTVRSRRRARGTSTMIRKYNNKKCDTSTATAPSYHSFTLSFIRERRESKSN